MDLVQENIAVIADDDSKVHHRLHFLVQLVEDVTDGLRAVPVSWLPPVCETNFRYAVDSEGAPVVLLQVVEEVAEQAVVFVEYCVLLIFKRGHIVKLCS